MSKPWDMARVASLRSVRKYKPVAPVGCDGYNKLRAEYGQKNPVVLGFEPVTRHGDMSCVCGFRVCCCDGNGNRAPRLLIEQPDGSFLDCKCPGRSHDGPYATHPSCDAHPYTYGCCQDCQAQLKWARGTEPRAQEWKCADCREYVAPEEYGARDDGVPIVYHMYATRGFAHLFGPNEPGGERVICGLLTRTQLNGLRKSTERMPAREPVMDSWHFA